MRPIRKRATPVGVFPKFVVNACRSKLVGRVELVDVERPDAAWRTDFRAHAWGVARIDLRPAALDLPLDQPFRFACDFDRRTPHRKPILFRRFADGSITGNHS